VTDRPLGLEILETDVKPVTDSSLKVLESAVFRGES